MADIFRRSDAHALLKKKFVLLLGDSNMRQLYKDLVTLVSANTMTEEKTFHQFGNAKWESHHGDKVLQRPLKETAGRNHVEEREYNHEGIHIRFKFITKCYGESVVSTMREIENGITPVPNIILMNSCLWDLCRWGPDREDDYKKELAVLFVRLKKFLPDETLIIWQSTLPTGIHTLKGGVIINQLNKFKLWGRFMIMEANKFTEQLCLETGIDYLDMHHTLRFQIDSRGLDGVHWETHAVRHMSCIFLTHVALSLNVALPGNFKSQALQDRIDKLSQNLPEVEDLEIEVLQIIEREMDNLSPEITERREIKKGYRRSRRNRKNYMNSGASQSEDNESMNNQNQSKKNRHLPPFPHGGEPSIARNNLNELPQSLLENHISGDNPFYSGYNQTSPYFTQHQNVLGSFSMSNGGQNFTEDHIWGGCQQINPNQFGPQFQSQYARMNMWGPSGHCAFNASLIQHPQVNFNFPSLNGTGYNQSGVFYFGK